MSTPSKGTKKGMKYRAGLLSALTMALAPLAAPAMVPTGVAGSPVSAFYALGFELGPWQDYLVQELTPAMNIGEQLPEPRISWLDPDQLTLLPVFATDLLDSDREQQTWLTFSYQDQLVTSFGGSQWLHDDRSFGDVLSRQFFTSGLRQSLGKGTSLDVGAVLAYQAYSSGRLGFVSSTDWPAGSAENFLPYHESSYGTGVKLGLHEEIRPGVSWDAGYQSRIDMEAFAAYRGVYSEPGDLDIPARAHLGLNLQTTPRGWFTLAVDRVMYSDVNAFASRNLPGRFLALLGDATSPEFAWQDLTVFSVGWRWRSESDVEWRFDVATRSQPEPTSAQLSSVLSDQLAENSLLLGYSQPAGRNGRFSLTAAYAPPEYAFGGNVLGVTSEELGQSFEIEAVYLVSF